MDKDKEKDGKGAEYAQWAKDWDDQLVKGQLTHIQSHPSVKKFVNEGVKAIPFILERLKENRLWYIPLERIIRNEFDEELKLEYPKGEMQKSVNEDPLEAKFADLEYHRKACIDWARRKGYLPEEK